MTPDPLRLPCLSRPLRIYFFADTHLQEHDPADPLVPGFWRKNPTPALPRPGPELLRSHLDRAIEHQADLILANGDLFHFPSPENAALAAELFAECPLPVWTVPGNHDWFYPGQDGWEDLRARQLPRLRDVYGDRPSHGVREFDGLRVIGLDNSTYFLTETQTRFLQNEVDHGPALVMMHIPLGTPSLREAVIAKHGNPILMNDPAGRVREGIDPAPTHNAARLLRTHPNVRAVLAAHVHLPFVEDIAPGVPQLIPEAGYRDGHRLLDCVPA